MATDTHKGLRLRAAVIPPLAKAEGSPDRFFMEKKNKLVSYETLGTMYQLLRLSLEQAPTLLLE